MSRLATHLVTYLLLASALLWPAFYNRQPFFFPDTTAYLRGADAAIQKLTHHSTPWTQSSDKAVRNGDASPVTSLSSVKDKTVLAGRSPYYGLLLYLGEITGGFWLPVVLQAAVILAVIVLSLPAAGIPLWPYAPLAGVLLAGATCLPFYVSFLMPDLFAGVTVLGSSVLLASRRTLDRWRYIAWFVLVASALTFHDSHVLIAAAMLLLAGLLNLRHGWGNRRGLLVLSLALVVAAVAQITFDLAVSRLVGAAPLRPPFLTARLIADGPGYRYLRATCLNNDFTVCQFIDRLPMSPDEFLWASGNPPGVFADAPPSVRRQLAAEQTPFLFSVLRYDPFGEAAAALHNATTQILKIRLPEFEYDETTKKFLDNKLPPRYLQPLHGSAAYRDTMPIGTISAIDLAAIAVAMAFVVLVAIQPSFRSRSYQFASVAIARWVLIGIALNALICGALSVPHDRYSARVVWLIPLVSLMIGFDLLRSADATRASVATAS
jgi:hypothetical protein